MKRLRFSQRFVAELKKITEHIAKDKPQSARAFKDALLFKIRAIPAMPYSYRQNPIADDECVRELIFKGFVVVFVISDSIDVLGIYKQNLWEM
ncbi:type II toxin-antitoxin system RelE/ParE family toxin [Helicobacter sp.]|uniref:type II toxin-antitoxin system RelE/ParE family toxin n=1 Tax=Helicobacter sp. TaxID=218 RepID=UPI0025C6D8DF|nr:type II toxin-antitoxin system RelE/ParE family toxin [Helicobacter sp.]MBR2493920.1 type II toxin-antitoxin system RelE/ParE family toxin [Helicobacter sp.]